MKIGDETNPEEAICELTASSRKEKYFRGIRLFAEWTAFARNERSQVAHQHPPRNISRGIRCHITVLRNKSWQSRGFNPWRRNTLWQSRCFICDAAIYLSYLAGVRCHVSILRDKSSQVANLPLNVEAHLTNLTVPPADATTHHSHLVESDATSKSSETNHDNLMVNFLTLNKFYKSHGFIPWRHDTSCWSRGVTPLRSGKFCSSCESSVILREVRLKL